MAQLTEKTYGDAAPNIREQLLLVVGIPAYNEERAIAKVILLAKRFADIVVVCDDGSTDMTGEIASGLGAIVVRHDKNLGYGAAIQSLFKQAKKLNADVLITLDGDGQHDARNVSDLLNPILDGVADVVSGSRFVGESQNSNNHIPRYRSLGIKMITRLTNSASGGTVSDAQNGFRAYSRDALEKLALSENGMGVSVEILVRAKELGLRLVEVPIGCNYSNVEKPSSYNPIRHGANVVSSLVKMIIEERPLTYLGVPGIASLALGTFFGIWMLQIYVTEFRIVTNIALASISFILIGFFAISTAITLYAILRLARAQKTKHA